MAAWRTLGSLIVVLAVVESATAQAHSLAESPKVGDCMRYHLEMSLTGEMRVNQGGKDVPLSLTAQAEHRFTERILVLGNDKLPHKTARHYEAAKATITVAKEPSQRTLRDTRRLLVAQRHRDQTVLYSPVGPLTREELELTAEHLDTLALTGLLPGKAVNVGDTWKVSNTSAQALCLFEGLTAQDLTCKLHAVKDGIATIQVQGTASGIILGAVVKLTIQATCRFDLEKSQLIEVEWKQQDNRDQGPANPALKVEVTTRLKRAAIEQPNELSNTALVAVPAGDEPPAALLPLLFQDAKARYSLLYQRDWQIVGETGQHLVLRLMDRGDFVAQATVTPWTSAKLGEHLSPQEFAQAMARTPGWMPEQELQAGPFPVEPGHWGYRLSVQGQLDGLPVVQNFYLVAGPTGAQVVVVFTMTPAQAGKIGTRDLTLVGSLTLPKK
jgi:hypothetical protein